MKRLLLILACAVAGAEQRAIDVQKSVLTIHVGKAGLFSAFGHDHEISAPIAKGTADLSAHQVELHVDAGALKVLDPNAAEKERAEIQETMLGPEVLDAARFPAISFRSESAESAGGVWKLRGSLTLHGQTRPMVLEVRENAGHYRGTAVLKQTDFGIKPVRAGGGTVRVKDELRVEFDIQLAP